MVGWHHWLDGRESEWTLEVGDGQGGLACCDSWGRKESNTTEWLNWTESPIKWLIQTMIITDPKPLAKTLMRHICVISKYHSIHYLFSMTEANFCYFINSQWSVLISLNHLTSSHIKFTASLLKCVCKKYSAQNIPSPRFNFLVAVIQIMNEQLK